MSEHRVGDLLLSYTPYGQPLLGMISCINVSKVTIQHDMYHIIWFNNEENEILNSEYTHVTVCKFKSNLEDYLYNYDKK